MEVRREDSFPLGSSQPPVSGSPGTGLPTASSWKGPRERPWWFGAQKLAFAKKNTGRSDFPGRGATQGGRLSALVRITAEKGEAFPGPPKTFQELIKINSVPRSRLKIESPLPGDAEMLPCPSTTVFASLNVYRGNNFVIVKKGSSSALNTPPSINKEECSFSRPRAEAVSLCKPRGLREAELEASRFCLKRRSRN